MIPKFAGTVQFGKLTLQDEDIYDNYLLSLNGEVEVTVRKKSNKRTLKQNQYYWAVVIRLIAEETGHTSEEIHDAMKQMFAKSIIKIKGEEYETVTSTTQLDTLEFSKAYVDQIKYWAWDTLNIVIPEPNNVE